MTNTYLIHAWCIRPFIAYLDSVQAATPEEAIAIARQQPQMLLDAAEECNGQYPWDEFAAYDQDGNELLHILDPEAQLRNAAALLPALQFALKELATAAEDLLAAIDGATDQFDPESAQLDAACTTARSLLSAEAVTIHDLLAGRQQIALIWSIEDVLAVRPDLTKQQAWKVLRQVERHHDAALGVTWDTLQFAAEHLFGPAQETDIA